MKGPSKVNDAKRRHLIKVPRENEHFMILKDEDDALIRPAKKLVQVKDNLFEDQLVNIPDTLANRYTPPRKYSDNVVVGEAQKRIFNGSLNDPDIKSLWRDASMMSLQDGLTLARQDASFSNPADATFNGPIDEIDRKELKQLVDNSIATQIERQKLFQKMKMVTKQDKLPLNQPTAYRKHLFPTNPGNSLLQLNNAVMSSLRKPNNPGLNLVQSNNLGELPYYNGLSRDRNHRPSQNVQHIIGIIVNHTAGGDEQQPAPKPANWVHLPGIVNTPIPLVNTNDDDEEDDVPPFQPQVSPTMINPTINRLLQQLTNKPGLLQPDEDELQVPPLFSQQQQMLPVAMINKQTVASINQPGVVSVSQSPDMQQKKGGSSEDSMTTKLLSKQNEQLFDVLYAEKLLNNNNVSVHISDHDYLDNSNNGGPISGQNNDHMQLVGMLQEKSQDEMQQGQPGLVAQPGSVGQSGLVGQTKLVGQSGLVAQPGLVAHPGLVAQSGLVGQPVLEKQPGLVGQSGLIGQSGIVGQLGLEGHPALQTQVQSQQMQGPHTANVMQAQNTVHNLEGQQNIGPTGNIMQGTQLVTPLLVPVHNLSQGIENMENEFGEGGEEEDFLSPSPIQDSPLGVMPLPDGPMSDELDPAEEGNLDGVAVNMTGVAVNMTHGLFSEHHSNNITADDGSSITPKETQKIKLGNESKTNEKLKEGIKLNVASDITKNDTVIDRFAGLIHFTKNNTKNSQKSDASPSAYENPEKSASLLKYDNGESKINDKAVNLTKFNLQVVDDNIHELLSKGPSHIESKSVLVNDPELTAVHSADSSKALGAHEAPDKSISGAQEGPETSIPGTREAPDKSISLLNYKPAVVKGDKNKIDDKMLNLTKYDLQVVENNLHDLLSKRPTNDSNKTAEDGDETGINEKLLDLAKFDLKVIENRIHSMLSKRPNTDRVGTATNEKETASNEKETASNKKETASNENETASNDKETASNKKETASNENETASDDKETASDSKIISQTAKTSAESNTSKILTSEEKALNDVTDKLGASNISTELTNSNLTNGLNRTDSTDIEAVNKEVTKDISDGAFQAKNNNADSASNKTENDDETAGKVEANLLKLETWVDDLKKYFNATILKKKGNDGNNASNSSLSIEEKAKEKLPNSLTKFYGAEVHTNSSKGQNSAIPAGSELKKVVDSFENESKKNKEQENESVSSSTSTTPKVSHGSTTTITLTTAATSTLKVPPPSPPTPSHLPPQTSPHLPPQTPKPPKTTATATPTIPTTSSSKNNDSHNENADNSTLPSEFLSGPYIVSSESPTSSLNPLHSPHITNSSFLLKADTDISLPHESLELPHISPTFKMPHDSPSLMRASHKLMMGNSLPNLVTTSMNLMNAINSMNKPLQQNLTNSSGDSMNHDLTTNETFAVPIAITTTVGYGDEQSAPSPSKETMYVPVTKPNFNYPANMSNFDLPEFLPAPANSMTRTLKEENVKNMLASTKQINGSENQNLKPPVHVGVDIVLKTSPTELGNKQTAPTERLKSTEPLKSQSVIDKQNGSQAMNDKVSMASNPQQRPSGSLENKNGSQALNTTILMETKPNNRQINKSDITESQHRPVNSFKNNDDNVDHEKSKPIKTSNNGKKKKSKSKKSKSHKVTRGNNKSNFRIVINIENGASPELTTEAADKKNKVKKNLKRQHKNDDVYTIKAVSRTIINALSNNSLSNVTQDTIKNTTKNIQNKNITDSPSITENVTENIIESQKPKNITTSARTVVENKCNGTKNDDCISKNRTMTIQQHGNEQYLSPIGQMSPVKTDPPEAKQKPVDVATHVRNHNTSIDTDQANQTKNTDVLSNNFIQVPLTNQNKTTNILSNNVIQAPLLQKDLKIGLDITIDPRTNNVDVTTRRTLDTIPATVTNSSPTGKNNQNTTVGSTNVGVRIKRTTGYVKKRNLKRRSSATSKQQKQPQNGNKTINLIHFHKNGNKTVNLIHFYASSHDSGFPGNPTNKRNNALHDGAKSNTKQEDGNIAFSPIKGQSKTTVNINDEDERASKGETSNHDFDDLMISNENYEQLINASIKAVASTIQIFQRNNGSEKTNLTGKELLKQHDINNNINGTLTANKTNEILSNKNTSNTVKSGLLNDDTHTESASTRSRSEEELANDHDKEKSLSEAPHTSETSSQLKNLTSCLDNLDKSVSEASKLFNEAKQNLTELYNETHANTTDPDDERFSLANMKTYEEKMNEAKQEMDKITEDEEENGDGEDGRGKGSLVVMKSKRITAEKRNGDKRILPGNLRNGVQNSRNEMKPVHFNDAINKTIDLPSNDSINEISHAKDYNINNKSRNISLVNEQNLQLTQKLSNQTHISQNDTNSNDGSVKKFTEQKRAVETSPNSPISHIVASLDKLDEFFHDIGKLHPAVDYGKNFRLANKTETLGERRSTNNVYGKLISAFYKHSKLNASLKANTLIKKNLVPKIKMPILT